MKDFVVRRALGSSGVGGQYLYNVYRVSKHWFWTDEIHKGFVWADTPENAVAQAVTLMTSHYFTIGGD